MIMHGVLQAAEPYLRGKTIIDLVVGISLIGCQLDSGHVGTSYVLRDGLPHGCSAFDRVRGAIGAPARDVAEWVVAPDNNLVRAVGSAVLTAAAAAQDLPDDNGDLTFGLDLRPDDVVGMIGMIRPVAAAIQPKVKELVVFDHGLWLHSEDAEPVLHAVSEQPHLLPKCDVVTLSGTSTINGTFDELLAMCERAREVVMIGPSTPMFPDGWRGTRVTVLAGSTWAHEHKDEIFRLISTGGGIKSLGPYMCKKAIRVSR